jgi:uncharacterized membrane protein YidH (DUF202 family)
MRRDPGLAGERTTLAWRRSGLSLAVAGIAIMRGIPTRAAIPGRPLVGLTVLGLAAITFIGSGRAAINRTRHPARPTAELADLAPVAVAVALAALAAFLVVALHSD